MAGLERSKRPNRQPQTLKHQEICLIMPNFPFCTQPQRLTQERFVNLFSTEVHTEKGRGSWIFASRKKEPDTTVRRADAVAVVAVLQQSGVAHLVMTREFRAPLGAYELSFPAGLIDPGESAETTAIRELKEETGLTLTRVVHVSPPLASSAGLTDETVALVYGEATGSVSRELQTEQEDIEVRLITIADIQQLLGSTQGDVFSSRLYPILLSYVAAGAIQLPEPAGE
jgi:ADP-ribose pyrophosphatase